MQRSINIIITSFLLTTAASAAEVTVNMRSITFDPKRVSVHPGDQVVWHNVSLTDHMAMADQQAIFSFDTGIVPPQKISAPVTFQLPGEYPYHCTVHGRTMSGVVVVE